MDHEILLARKVSWERLNDKLKKNIHTRKNGKNKKKTYRKIKSNKGGDYNVFKQVFLRKGAWYASCDTPGTTRTNTGWQDHRCYICKNPFKQGDIFNVSWRTDALYHYSCALSEEEKWEYRILGKHQSPPETDGRLGPTRVIMMVKLKKPYYTLLDGSEKYWTPFYISSGAFRGSVKGRSQPFYGIINSFSKTYDWFHPEKYDKKKHITIPKHTDSTKDIARDLFNAINSEYTVDQKYLISRKLLTYTWFIKCGILNTRPFILFHKLHLQGLNTTKQDILKKRINDLKKPFFQIDMPPEILKCVQMNLMISPNF